jgi:hypothetical protein
VRKKRRYTYPIVLLDQCAYEQQFKETTEPGLILRRWSTIRKQKKRRTLADIISNLTDPTLHNIIDNKNTDDVLKSMALEARWDSIRQYDNNNNGSKIEEESEQGGVVGGPLLVVRNKEDEKTESTPTMFKATTRTSLTVRIPSPQTNNTLMDSGININSSLLAHPPSSSHSTGRQQLDQHRYSSSGTSTDDSIRISMPINGGSEKQKGHSTLDMFLFLFGFILFPLWWVGSWRYFTRKYDKKERKDVFQILNCCMSLASLLLIGLIIGLTTVWA